MGGAAFRMFFGDRAATTEELARVEEILVEQEMRMAWEARIRMVLCLDDQGRCRLRTGRRIRSTRACTAGRSRSSF